MSGIKKGLGRGLEALFSETGEDVSGELTEPGTLIELDIDLIEPMPGQPREAFGRAALDELAESLAKYGVLQPLIVVKEGEFYRIIAGERRYRAARIARLEKLPVIVREFDEIQRLQAALVENLQREDLNIMEEARSYKKLMDEFSLTQEEVAESVSKSRSAVANCLRLLNLDRRVQQLAFDRKLTMGHARALLGVPEGELQLELAEKIVEDGLSVRQTEDLIKKITEAETKPIRQYPEKSPLFKSIEHKLSSHLGTKVSINIGKKRGKIEIDYYSDDDLDRLLTLIVKP